MSNVKKRLTEFESAMVPIQDQPKEKMVTIVRRLKMNEDEQVQAVGEMLRRSLNLLEQK